MSFRRSNLPSALLVCALFVAARISVGEDAPFRVGMARRDANPVRPQVVVGLASSPYHNVRFNDLAVYCAVIEDSAGGRVALVSADTLHFDADRVDRLKAELLRRHGLAPQAVMMNASHTHSAPPLSTLTVDSPSKVDPDYVAYFEEQLLGVVGDALHAMRPASLSVAEDSCDVAINRRLMRDGEMDMRPNPAGSVDRAVQTLIVRDAATGALAGVVVKYACHPVTMSLIGLGASYPGFMIEDVRRNHRGLHVQFVQGCTGDCRPILVDEAVTRFIPGTLELCKTFGASLAAAVERALAKDARDLSGPVSSRATSIDLPIRVVDRAEFASALESSTWYMRRWGKEHLAMLDSPGGIVPCVPFRVQIFRIGAAPDSGLLLVGLDGEVFSGYSFALARRLAPWPVIALAYSNAMAGYIPTAEEIPKGGYEVGAYTSWNRPGPFLPEIEELILSAAERLARSN